MKTIDHLEARAKFYSPLEERLNIWSHGTGLVLAIVGCLLLILQTSEISTSPNAKWSKIIFGISMVVLYSCSVLYHRTEDPILRSRYRVWDHMAIYVLIAGTYTPFCLITLYDGSGWLLFFTIWGIALAGIVFKIFFTGNFDLLSTTAYILMGWLAILFIRPLMQNLPHSAQMWMLIGGIAYTIGGILYAIKSVPMNHAIFHFFVLVGTFCHFWAVYWYL